MFGPVGCSTGSQCQRKNERAIYRNACNGYRSGDNIVSHCLKSIRLVVMKLDITCFQHNFNGIFRLIVCKSTACFWWSVCCACSKAYTLRLNIELIFPTVIKKLSDCLMAIKYFPCRKFSKQIAARAVYTRSKPYATART